MINQDKINILRAHHIKKTYKSLDLLLIASLDNDKNLHAKYKEDLETSLMIMWKSDRKLQRLRGENQDESLTWWPQNSEVSPED